MDKNKDIVDKISNRITQETNNYLEDKISFKSYCIRLTVISDLVTIYTLKGIIKSEDGMSINKRLLKLISI